MLNNANSNASTSSALETPYAAGIVEHVTKYVGAPAFVIHEVSSEMFTGSTEIDLWTLWPIYRDELEFTKRHGSHAFADVIEASDVSDVTDPERASLVGSNDFAQPAGGGADSSAMKNKITVPDVPGFETTVEPIPDGVDPMTFLQQQMDDCPLCREARARGEVPTLHTGDELGQMAPHRRGLFAKRPRWRTLKKRR